MIKGIEHTLRLFDGAERIRAAYSQCYPWDGPAVNAAPRSLAAGEDLTVIAYLLFLTFIAHFGAVLFHTLIVRDGLFDRMARWRVRTSS